MTFGVSLRMKFNLNGCQAELAAATVEAGVVSSEQVRQSTLSFKASFDQAAGRFSKRHVQ